MRIAQIAPIVERVPPTTYGGTERMVAALTDELVRRGHEVTLFASGDSTTSARLESVYPRALRDSNIRDIYGSNSWTLLNIGMAYEMQDEFDIIHDHLMPLSLATANLATTPVVGTMHGPFTPENSGIFQHLTRPSIVTISRAQGYTIPGLNHAGTVYNGLDLKEYPFSEEHDDYLLFVGRLSPEKGPHIAIEAAKQLNRRLILAAKLDEIDRPYFEEFIEPFLSESILWIGEVDQDTRNQLMSKAHSFLHPVTWPEPFGLTLIEAMACGCPVVAMAHGSIPEIIKHGETGYVVQDIETMLEGIMSIDRIDRKRCREYALENFSAEKMTNGYEEIYKKVLNG